MVAHHIKTLTLKWLRPLERTSEEVAEEMCVEHFIALLPFKPKRWVTKNIFAYQPRTLEDTILLMEAYTVAEAGIYLKKNLQRQANQLEQSRGPCCELIVLGACLEEKAHQGNPLPSPHPSSTNQDPRASPENASGADKPAITRSIARKWTVCG